ncbi:MAG: hypothetical protein AAF756_22595 [Pseudomonadota bacterium]
MNETFDYRRLAFISTPLWLGFVFVYSRLGFLAAIFALFAVSLSAVRSWERLGLKGGLVEKALFEIGFVLAGSLFMLTVEVLDFSSDEKERNFLIMSFLVGMGFTSVGIFCYQQIRSR